MPSENSGAPRNAALDWLRVIALCFMVLAHMWRMLLGKSTLDGIVTAVVETGHVPFFLTFGMTQRRLLKKSSGEVASRFVLLGTIAALHSYFMWFNLSWDFFPFLWAALLFVLAGNWVGLRYSHFTLLAALVIILNALWPMGVGLYPLLLGGEVAQSLAPASQRAARLWLTSGVFYPLPWAAVVFLGVAMGTRYPVWLRKAWVCGTLGAVLVLAIAAMWVATPSLPMTDRLSVAKWSATSAYLLGSVAFTLLLYAGFGRCSHTTPSIIRYLSQNLLEATVLHYLAFRILMDGRWGWATTHLGQRTAAWSEVGFLSIANLGLLILLVALVVRAWHLLSNRFESRIRKLAGLPTAILGLASAAAAGVAHQHHWMAPFPLKWTLFAMLLLVALMYRSTQQQRLPTAPVGGRWSRGAWP